MQKIINTIVRLEKKTLGQNLRALGLYVEDTYQSDDITNMAVRRLPEDIQADRIRRIRRALDLSLKHVELPKEFQIYDPFLSYGLDKHYDDIVREVAESRAMKTN